MKHADEYLRILAENRLLMEALNKCHVEYGACCEDCPMCFESADEERCHIAEGTGVAPLTTAEVARARALEEVWEELRVMRQEYGEACDHSLTRDAIDLKAAICRVWDELELHVDGFAALDGAE